MEERRRERLTPEPEPPRKMIALAADPVEDVLHRVLDREDEAGRALRLLLEADVEPDRAVEGGELVDEDRLELVLEGLRLLVVGEVAVRAAPAADGVDDAADHLLDGLLAVGGGHAPAEVLLRDDVGGRLRPELRELDAPLLEGRAVLAGDQRVARLPLDLVEGIAPRNGEEPAHADLRIAVGDTVLDPLAGGRYGLVLLLGGRHAGTSPVLPEA